MRIPFPLAAIAALAIAGPAAAVEVTDSECRQVVAHQPAADVAYRPGVDVAGNAVAPADLNGGLNLAIPTKISIPITLEIDKRYGIPKTTDLYKPEADLGKVVWENGKLTYNGQPLQSESEARLIAACQDALAK